MIYKFKDLPKEMQDNLIAIESNCDYDWHEECVSKFIDEMRELYGISIASKDIRFSGFGSQGDGASFTTDSGGIDALTFVLNSGFQFDFEREKYEFLGDFTNIVNFYEDLTKSYVTLKVTRNSYNYSHENTVDAVVHFEEPVWVPTEDEDAEEKGHAFIDALEKHFAEFVNQACKHLYNTLEIEWTSLFGKSAVLARLEKCTWKKYERLDSSEYYELYAIDISNC